MASHNQLEENRDTGGMDGGDKEQQNQSSNKAHTHCCVPYCFNNTRKDECARLSFHRIPSNKIRRKIWIIKIWRDPGKHFEINSATRICSAHFKTEDIRTTSSGKRYLLFSAVPSIFPWSKPLQSGRRALRRAVIADRSMQEITEEDFPDNENDSASGILTTDSDVLTDSVNGSYQQPNALEDHSNYNIEEKTCEEKLADAQQTIEWLTMKLQGLSLTSFGTERFRTDDDMFQYYTGFTSYALFIKFFTVLSAHAAKIPLWSTVRSSVMSGQTSNFNKRAMPRTLPLVDELFLFLCRLRQGFDEKDLKERFRISLSSVSRIIITWANFLYFCLASLPLWPARVIVDKYMPRSFKTPKFSQTRVIIDCCELPIQVPSSLLLQSEFYSPYKTLSTCKCLIGIAPHGPVTFISNLYVGSISDKELTRRSGLLQLLEPGDSLLADKGFTIRDLLEPIGVGLNIPPFNFNGRFTADEVAETQQIATQRVQVERAIRRAHEYQLFEKRIPLSIVGTLNQFWTVACILGNFSGPLFKKR